MALCHACVHDGRLRHCVCSCAGGGDRPTVTDATVVPARINAARPIGGRLASLDVMELNPALDVRNQTAAVAVDLIESLFGKSTLMRN